MYPVEEERTIVEQLHDYVHESDKIYQFSTWDQGSLYARTVDRGGKVEWRHPNSRVFELDGMSGRMFIRGMIYSPHVHVSLVDEGEWPNNPEDNDN